MTFLNAGSDRAFDSGFGRFGVLATFCGDAFAFLVAGMVAGLWLALAGPLLRLWLAAARAGLVDFGLARGVGTAARGGGATSVGVEKFRLVVGWFSTGESVALELLNTMGVLSD